MNGTLHFVPDGVRAEGAVERLIEDDKERYSPSDGEDRWEVIAAAEAELAGEVECEDFSQTQEAELP